MSLPAGQPATGALPSGQESEALVTEVRRVLDEAVPAGAAVVLAVSGGPDSTALAFLARRARQDLDAHVAHVRHGLREDTSDAAVAAEHAAALSLPFLERRVRVTETGEGLAAAARQARYAALAGVADDVGAEAVLVGHTADDQAETVVLNLARGTGLSGLAAMDPVTRYDTPDDGFPAVDLVRPLLRLRRTDLHAFVAHERLPTVSDPSNQDPARRRVRVRQEVLPALARLSGATGDPVGALTRLADLARADAHALDTWAKAQARQAVVTWGPGRAVRTADLDQLPRAVASRVLRQMIAELGSAFALDAATVDQVVALQPGQSCYAAGSVWVTRGGGWLAAVHSGATELGSHRVVVPGGTALPELGLTVRAEVAETPQAGTASGPSAEGLRPPGTKGPTHGVLPRSGPLVVRARRHGDRLGRKPLADLLTETGVPRALRGLVPVVASPDDVPRWVPGLGQADPPPEEGPAVRLWLAPLR